MRSVLSALCLFASTAHAVPAQFTHQGRLLDTDGAPLEDDATITFRVINADTGGDILWEEAISVSLTNGFYSAVLGADESNPLDTTTFAEAPVWLELQLEGEGAMFPRSPINAVPYASMATVAEEVSGGPVNASEISVGDTPVVNESGEWVGPAPTVSWDDLTDVPADFADGTDDDTPPGSDSFADLGTSCLDGDIPVWDGTTEEWSCTFDQDSLADMECTEGQLVRWADDSLGWVCSDDVDTTLTADEVNTIVAEAGYAMGSEVFSGSFLDLDELPDGLLDGDDNTQLTADEVDAIVEDNGYAMSEDLFSGLFNELTGIPDGLLDGDDNTQLTADEVDAIVADNGYAAATDIFSGLFTDLAGIPSGFADGDNDTLNDLDCEPGEIAIQTETGWACSTISEHLDADGDGFPVWDDCDDLDASSGSSAADADCDGVATSDDCNDTDAHSTTKATDADCDGVLTDEDCDDEDPFSSIVAEDGDCDGVVTTEDCDDSDPSSSDIAEDADCDGIPSDYDCRPLEADSSIDEEAMVGAASSCPIDSCTEAMNNHQTLFSPASTWTGGHYHIGDMGSSKELYCEPADDGGDPWTYLVQFDAMTDSCPSSWTPESMGAYNLCSRNTDGVRSHTFPVSNLEFSELQGSITGAAEASLDGFQVSPVGDLMGTYADGIGVRMGSDHLYTFALGHDSHHCSHSPPGFVRDDHNCTVVDYSSAYSGPHGTGWWSSDIGPRTAGPVTVQLMADQDIDDEDVAIMTIDIKVR